MSNRLEVPIGADKTDFDKKLKEVEQDIKELSKIKLERIQLGLDTKEIDGNIKSAKKSLSDLKTSLKDTGDSFTKMSPKVANGGNTLMQFSRIAQDAPFGIMGIGNNITATAESFSYLSKSAGGTGNALKAIASSMMGTGGILLAVSLVTSGLTYMSQNGITVGDVFDKLTGKFDETAQAMKKIGQEATKTAGEEISSINSYLSVAKNRELSDEKRLLAVKKLQDSYPAYFGNLTREQILNGNVGDAVRDVSKALRERAIATALDGKLGEQAVKRLELEEKREKAILFLQKSQKAVAEQRKGNGSIFTNEEGQLKVAESLYKAIVSEINTLDSVSKKYSDRASKATANSIDLLQEEEKAIKKVKEAKAVTPRSAPLSPVVPLNPITEFATSTKIAEASISSSFANLRANADVSMIAMLEALSSFNEQATGIINSGISSTFANLGQAIGQGLASGGNILESAGLSLLSSLGGILTELGKMAIGVGVGLLGIKAALKTLNPAVAIGAGVALVALGGFVSSKASGISTSIGSGSTSISSGADYSSPASSGGSYSSSNSGGGTVVFEISGQSLIGVLSNTVNKNTRLGGTL